MLRAFTLAVLFALGVASAFNVGNWMGMLFYATFKNPVTIALTTFLRDYAPPAIVNLEQKALHYLTYAPYSFLTGMIATPILGPRLALRGIAFWAGFALTFSILLIREGMNWVELPRYAMIPEAIGFCCTVPIFAIGVAVVPLVRRPHIPRFTLIDLIAATGAFALLSLVAVTESEWLSPLVFIVTSTGIACRLYLWTFNATTSSLATTSDKIRSLELNQLLSPPEDQ